ncbi:MAG: glycosyltransferase family 4 protein [Lentisphaerae bacterium]|nr:glycosyltransferase family 4 protein [Lentisphaerota bacterium]
MMHILQLLPALNEGGVERGVVEINRELVRRGVRNTVISAGGRLAPQIDRDGGRHLTLDVKSKNLLTVPERVRRLRVLIAELNPDIIHVRSRVPAWLARFANRNPRRPVVSTVHGLYSVNAYSRIMTRADRVICVSQAAVEYVRKNYGTPDSLIRLVHRGIDPVAFDPARLDADYVRAFKTRHALDGRFVVLAVGRITSLKGYRELIQAAALARGGLRDKAPLAVVIVGGVQQGQEAYAAALRALVTQLNLDDAVVFAGSHTRMAEIYDAADVVVSCSTSKPETFGRSMIEALAMNRPVIATRHGGALDIMREGVTGWLVEPGDVAGLAAGLVKAAHTRLTGLRTYALERFSLDAMVEKNLAIYRDVLDGAVRAEGR